MQEGNSREMDTLWGEDVIALRAENAERGQLFNDGRLKAKRPGRSTFLHLETTS